MTIPSAFVTKGTGDKLTAGDVNTLNADIQMALDKRAGVTDTLGSLVTMTGSGRIISTFANAANVDTTYLVTGANSIIMAPPGSVTANRTYTLSATGALAGDKLSILNQTSFYFTVVDGTATTLIVLGAQIQSNGESTWANFIFNGAQFVLWESSIRPVVNATTFTASGTWTCPRGVTLVMLTGYGGGGGGGGGSPGSGTNNAFSSTGGGGGGGSQLSYQVVPVTAGTGYAVTIGAGGIVVIATATGTDGAPTTFGSLATFAGAGGGASTASLGAGVAYQTFGGAPVALNAATTSVFYNGRTQLIPTPGGDSVQLSPGSGGRSLNQAANNVGFVSLAGTPSAQGFAGGAGGGFGGTSTGVGGGGGGGGGGGPAGVGGAGGTGGNGSATIAVTNGSAGTSAAANTGAGGGGGGGGGTSTAGGATGSGSGAGGSGQLIVVPLR